MSNDAKSSNIVKYRKPININIGMIIFVIIAIYIFVCVVMYFRSNPIVGYEVKEGSLSISTIYTGIALRDEEIVTAKNSGYINYYAREGEKVSVGDLVYTIDESGRLKDMLADSSLGENSLSEKNLDEIKADIIQFQREFNPLNYSNTYNFKYNLQGTSLKLSNLNILESLDAINSTAGYVNLCYSDKSGYVVYSTDGYEDKTIADITTADFDNDDYKKIPLIGNEMIGNSDPVYKYITDEKWSIVIPIDEERATQLADTSSVKIKFLKSQTSSVANIEIISKEDGKYAILTLQNSVMSFCTERFIDIELCMEQENGLKIPNSAIAEKEFFLIPKEFAVRETEAEDTYVFAKESYMEDGTVSVSEIELSVYNETDTDFYVDDIQLTVGDVIQSEDSQKSYTISKKATLIGVYNINKGYADFSQISILYSNEEYAIVKPNTNYGLRTYDYIVLEAESVSDEDFVYE